MNIKILTGSTRPGRFNIQPAEWIYKIAKAHTDIHVELVDLQEVNLPFLDESTPPMMHKYEKPHTKAWSKTIDEADGFIFVTPEYNHSFSAVLKNAIDYLSTEWNYKPVAFVSYGSLAGGSRAVEHLRSVAAEVRLYDLRDQVMFPNYWEHLDSKGQYEFNDRNKDSAELMLNALIFWARHMEQAREELNKAK